jgi:hypothetical protein
MNHEGAKETKGRGKKKVFGVATVIFSKLGCSHKINPEIL